MTSDMPGKLLFVDVETTGLTYDDRIVTLGLVSLDLDTSGPDQPQIRLGHFIFNPGRPSNSFAAAVHGYDDWTLRHQSDFGDLVEDILPFFREPGRIVAHNASFDERFVRTALCESAVEVDLPKFFCTMRAWRARHGAPAGLDPVITQLGIKSRGKQHGALEDAWLCMRVYLHLHGLPCPDAPEHLQPLAFQPVNWVEPGPKPVRGMRKIHGG